MFRQTISFVKIPLGKVHAPPDASDALFANAIPLDQLPVVRSFLSVTPLISVRTQTGFEVLDTHLLGLARLALKPKERIALAVLSTEPKDRNAAHLAMYAARSVVQDLRPRQKALLAGRLLQLPPMDLTSVLGAKDQRGILRMLRVNERTFRKWQRK